MKRYIGLASRAGAIACCLLFLVGCEKSRLDEEVRQLCAKDGGIKIYETVKLPSERFDQHGNIKIPSKKDANPSDEYYYESETIFLRSGNPDLRRSHDKIIRRHDQKCWVSLFTTQGVAATFLGHGTNHILGVRVLVSSKISKVQYLQRMAKNEFRH